MKRIWSLAVILPLAFASPVRGEMVRIGLAESEIQTRLIPKHFRFSSHVHLSSPFILDHFTQDPSQVSHGTLSYLALFQGLGSEFQLVSLAEVGHYATLQKTDSPYRMGKNQVFNKQDDGRRFYQTHTRAGASVIYLGWPINAGNATINSVYLKRMVRKNVILVEVAPALDQERGFVISEDDRYTLKVGAVAANGQVSPSSRRQGVDIFCPSQIELPGGFIFSDTSAAAAICARYVAQLKSVDPNLDLENIRELLNQSGDPAPPGASARIANIQNALMLLKGR